MAQIKSTDSDGIFQSCLIRIVFIAKFMYFMPERRFLLSARLADDSMHAGYGKGRELCTRL